jgi:hypothetical protein
MLFCDGLDFLEVVNHENIFTVLENRGHDLLGCGMLLECLGTLKTSVFPFACLITWVLVQSGEPKSYPGSQIA